jgi:hypothetical protein
MKAIEMREDKTSAPPVNIKGGGGGVSESDAPCDTPHRKIDASMSCHTSTAALITKQKKCFRDNGVNIDTIGHIIYHPGKTLSQFVSLMRYSRNSQ